MELTPTTELEAVNVMLGAIGELPVHDLETVGNTDTAIALRTLHGISREVQSKGWWFNVDDAHTFTLNAENRVQLANPILSIRPQGRGAARLAPRNGFLYNVSAATDEFDPEAPPSARVVWFMEFEFLPETVRRYIAVRAARIFQTSVLGSETQDHFSESHERDTFALMMSEQDDFDFAQGHNMFRDDLDTSAIAGIG